MINASLTKNLKQAQLMGDTEIISLIREHFSIKNPVYKHSSFTPSRIYAITPQGKFDIGLYGEINNFCLKNQIPLKCDNQLLSIFSPGLTHPSVLELNKTYRDYQEKSIFQALKQGRGVIVIPTAGGKTLIMAGLLKSLKEHIKLKKVLVIVPSLQLVEQTAEDFLSYGLTNVNKWHGNSPYNPNAEINVAGTQILLSKKTDLSVLADVDLLLVDEVHSVRRGNEINHILKFVNCLYKFGFTGTLPSSKIDEWNIIGKFGPILYEEKTDTLKKKSFVSNFKIIILNIKHSNIPHIDFNSLLPAAAFLQETEFLQNSARRNEIITNLAFKLKENTLIMVDRIEHGEILLNILKNNTNSENRPIYFIQGATAVEDREEIRSLMDKRRDVIVVAISKIFSTGINIPNLHNIIFASIGKAKIKIMQSIGRVLRLHPTKQMAVIFDITDNTKYGKKHVEERKKMYKLENYEYTEKEIL